MSSTSSRPPVKNTLDIAKDLLRSKGIEEQFLKASGLNSLDELDPKNFEDLVPTAPPAVMKPAAPSAPQHQKPLPKEAADSSTGFKPTTASDMLQPYIGLNIQYAPRKVLSSYTPSSLMMDYLVHTINDLLVDNFYFRRACPDYHPYILRLYYGVLFWIQCLRAALEVRALTFEQHIVLTRFLDAFPPESLTVSSPLLDLFKTLCASQPEIPTYGKVYPILPSSPGPAARSEFLRNDPNSLVIPNIPGIFALLEHLNSQLNPANPAQAVFPAKGQHVPVPAASTQATIFGHHSFPIPTERTDLDKWSLCSSGLQYPCEADKKLHENFAERYANFGFPTTAGADDLQLTAFFLGMDGPLTWFAQVKEVAAIEASFFEGSGTLADCPPYGLAANQLKVCYQAPSTLPVAPTKSADPAALFPFVIRLRTTARSVPELAEVMAATAQTNIRMFTTHPFLGTVGSTNDHGPFWSIRPIESSRKDESSFLALKSVIRGLIKPKG